jgi:hypothetical protein
MRNYLELNPASPAPARAISFIQRKARVSEAQARVIAGLFGLPSDEWQSLGASAARVVATSAWRAHA